ncbi:UNVERIFIED_CONTAM: hypothetical protein K2H54_058003 [Gekko kuhli]
MVARAPVHALKDSQASPGALEILGWLVEAMTFLHSFPAAMAKPVLAAVAVLGCPEPTVLPSLPDMATKKPWTGLKPTA